MQSLDPRVRVVGTFPAGDRRRAGAQDLRSCLRCFAGAVVLLALASAITLRTLALRVWLVVLAFTGVIALPALFLTPGDPLSASCVHYAPGAARGRHADCAGRSRSHADHGARALTTPWAQILKALRSLYVPKEVVMMLAMAHRYIFLLAETATQMFESRESRRVGVLRGPASSDSVVAQTAGVLMSKSIDLSQEVFLAMQSRGYRGDVVRSRSSGCGRATIWRCWRSLVHCRSGNMVGTVTRLDCTVRMPRCAFRVRPHARPARPVAGDRGGRIDRAGRGKRLRQVHAAAPARRTVLRLAGNGFVLRRRADARSIAVRRFRPAVSPSRRAGLSESRRTTVQSHGVR